MIKAKAKPKKLSLLWGKIGMIAVVILTLFPLISFLKLPFDFFNNDRRKLINNPEFIVRNIDTTGKAKLFEEPLITLTFDDGRETVYSQAFPLLAKYGIHTTQYLLSGSINDQSYLSYAQIKQMYESGHEIGCHTVGHLDITTLSDKDLEHELSQCKKTFEKFGPVTDFASPYGHADDRSLSIVEKYYTTHRNTSGDITNTVTEDDVNLAETFDRYNIMSVAIRKDTTIEQLQEAIDFISTNNGWLVLAYHQIEDDNNATFGLDPKSLNSQLEFISNAPIKIATMQEALKLGI